MKNRNSLVASAPGRAGIVGNPSDMYGGSVIAVAIARRAFVSIQASSSLRLVALDANRALDIKSVEDLALTAPPSTADAGSLEPDDLKDSRLSTYLNVLKAVVTAQNMLHVPVHIVCWSDIPPNAGLASSSALLVAALHATDVWLEREHGLHELSERAREIEFREMGVTCGFQDFYATTFGGLTYLDFRGKARWRGPNVDPFATVEPLLSPSQSVPLVLAHTGQQRDSGETHRPLRERWVDGDLGVREVMRKLGSIARQSKRHVLENDWSSVGKYMNQAHKQIVSVGGSGVVNDTLISRAMAFGARGAKLAGAGKGGTIIALHDDPVTLVDDFLESGVEWVFQVDQVDSGVRIESPGFPTERSGEFHQSTSWSL